MEICSHKKNPADHLTRGLKVSELIEENSWWEGPEYLRSSESEWPTNTTFKRSEQVKIVIMSFIGF